MVARPSTGEPGDVQLAFPLSASVRALVDDATGSIVYTPHLVPAATAQAWYRALHDEVEWAEWSRPMYDRVVVVPRLTAHFGAADQLPCALAAARGAVEARLGEHFDSFGLNFYRSRDDSVAPHHDQTGDLDPAAPIALLSLGSTRLMRIASLTPPRRSLSIALEPGSLLVMSPLVQAHWTHAVPKVRVPVGPRISIAFRRRKQPAAALSESAP